MSSKRPPDITVFDIANWFLAKAKDENKPLKNMKLQKLVYFAYGWHGVYGGTLPLFTEEILVWRRGVVIKVLYDEHKACGDHPIIVENCTYPNLCEDIVVILNSVWNAYAPVSDTVLNKLIRRHMAWRKAQRSPEWDAVMLPETIQSSFKEMIAKFANVKQ
jgi:uncharacterized phage-associated protein